MNAPHDRIDQESIITRIVVILELESEIFHHAAEFKSEFFRIEVDIRTIPTDQLF